MQPGRSVSVILSLILLVRDYNYRIYFQVSYPHGLWIRPRNTWLRKSSPDYWKRLRNIPLGKRSTMQTGSHGCTRNSWDCLVSISTTSCPLQISKTTTWMRARSPRPSVHLMPSAMKIWMATLRCPPERPQKMATRFPQWHFNVPEFILWMDDRYGYSLCNIDFYSLLWLFAKYHYFTCFLFHSVSSCWFPGCGCGYGTSWPHC